MRLTIIILALLLAGTPAAPLCCSGQEREPAEAMGVGAEAGAAAGAQNSSENGR